MKTIQIRPSNTHITERLWLCTVFCILHTSSIRLHVHVDVPVEHTSTSQRPLTAEDKLAELE